MYASDVIHRNRSQAVYRNLQLQKDWFNSGGTIRILGQKGGNDYAYMTEVQEGLIADRCWSINVPISITLTNGPVPSSLSSLSGIDVSGVFDYGYGGFVGASLTVDDASIKIPMAGMDFYFNGINYASQNNIYWNTNSAITFGEPTQGTKNVVSISANTIPAILLGNYDRLFSKLYYGTSFVTKNKSDFMITQLVVIFSNYYNDTTNLTAGQMRIRIIRELTGNNRQWVEVGIISPVTNPGYSNNRSVASIDSSGNIIDSNGSIVDPTKNSPWDITNGTNFLNVAGNAYSGEFPKAGTTFLYQSDKMGQAWQFINNAYLDTY